MSKTIAVTEFKSKCLGLIEEVANGTLDSVVLTKHGKAVAELRSLEVKPDLSIPIWGCMAGTVHIPPGVDITEPTGEIWNANIE